MIGSTFLHIKRTILAGLSKLIHRHLIALIKQINIDKIGTYRV